MKKLLVLFLLMVVFSCNDVDDCQLDPYQDFLGINFSFLDPADVTLIIFEEVGVEGLGVFSGVDTVSSTLFLPIDIEQTTTQFNFKTDSGDFRLLVGYERTSFIYERDCDISEIYDNLSILESNFDSVRVTQELLNKNDLNNIEVFF